MVLLLASSWYACMAEEGLPKVTQEKTMEKLLEKQPLGSMEVIPRIRYLPMTSREYFPYNADHELRFSFIVPDDWSKKGDFIIELLWWSREQGECDWEMHYYTVKAGDQQQHPREFHERKALANAEEYIITSTGNAFSIPGIAVDPGDIVNIRIVRTARYQTDTIDRDVWLEGFRIQYLSSW